MELKPTLTDEDLKNYAEDWRSQIGSRTIQTLLGHKARNVRLKMNEL